MNLTQIIDIVQGECDRQKVGPDRVVMLLRAYAATPWTSTPTLAMMLTLAGTLEPNNDGQIRHTPVTFAGAGTAPPANVVPRALHRLFAAISEGTADPDQIAREFLAIHPLSDGNGRTAWLLRTWLTRTENNPQPLPDYHWTQ